jgi:hypothetical protein
MRNTLRHYTDQLSTGEIIAAGLTASALIALGFTATARTSDPERIPGSIHCEGIQDVTAGEGDVFGTLVDTNVDTNMGPSDLPHLVDGITHQIITEGLPDEFVIPPSRYYGAFDTSVRG